MQLLLLACFFIFVYYFSHRGYSPYMLCGAFIIIILLNDPINNDTQVPKALPTNKSGNKAGNKAENKATNNNNKADEPLGDCKDNWDSHQKRILDKCCQGDNCVDDLPLICTQECSDAVSQSFEDCSKNEGYFDIHTIEDIYKKERKSDEETKHIHEYTQFKYMKGLCDSFDMNRFPVVQQSDTV